MSVVRVTSKAELADAYDVRVAVFVDEQGVPEAMEFDEYDATATHFVAYDGDTAVGAARLRDRGTREGRADATAGSSEGGVDATAGSSGKRADATGSSSEGRADAAAGSSEGGADAAADELPRARVAKVERVAVREHRRGEGWGTAIMDAVEDVARDAGYDVLELHAQTHAADFYARRGYETDGEPFDEAGIPHVHMTRPADPR